MQVEPGAWTQPRVNQVMGTSTLRVRVSGFRVRRFVGSSPSAHTPTPHPQQCTRCKSTGGQCSERDGTTSCKVFSQLVVPLSILIPGFRALHEIQHVFSRPGLARFPLFCLDSLLAVMESPPCVVERTTASGSVGLPPVGRQEGGDAASTAKPPPSRSLRESLLSRVCTGKMPDFEGRRAGPVCDKVCERNRLSRPLR